MKSLKRIVYILLVLIAIIIIIAYLLPRHSHVERSLLIVAPAEQIFEQVNTLKNWPNWSPWHKLDPNMEIEYLNSDKGEGAKYTWKSANEKVGNGSLTITKSIPYDTISAEMDFMDNGKASSNFIFTKSDSGIIVKWTMDSDLGWNPVSRYFGLMLDRIIGPEFQKGLNSLNEIVAVKLSSATGGSFTLKETDILPLYTLSVRDTCAPAAISSKLGAFYKEVRKTIIKNGFLVAGAPFAIYHSYSPQQFDLEAGIPVNKPAKDFGKIKAGEIKSGKAVVAEYFGPYEGTEKAHKAIEEYLKRNNKTSIGAPWEVYMTDPESVTDPSQLLTIIYYRIK
jgi:effector-binding domain-containing protein